MASVSDPTNTVIKVMIADHAATIAPAFTSSNPRSEESHNGNTLAAPVL